MFLLIYCYLGMIILNVSSNVYCYTIDDPIKVNCTLRAEPQIEDYNFFSDDYTECINSEGSIIHKCDPGSCFNNAVCDNCYNLSSVHMPRQKTNNLTCQNSYTIPNVSKSATRNISNYITCDSALGNHLCKGPCKFFKSCDICTK
ncbi:expressed protein [Phakopsora pachyrhizi]|uniref:Expressed protein n=1 Tax=Phakopsora pachyrhizi TaxID=170000 RepID=A0AAV0BPK6_PHAPC|nr:expressed protein [Phakopsora pachyrhizi]